MGADDKQGAALEESPKAPDAKRSQAKASPRPAFGRATASRVSPMPDQRKVFAMYGGMPPISLLISRFARENEESGLERKAALLLRELNQAHNREECYSRMEDLADKGSRLAAYVLAVAKMSGQYGERDEEAAKKALLALCGQKFRPAFAQLASCLAPRDLANPQGQALWPTIKRGIRLGDVHCLHLAALAWREGWIAPTPHEFTAIIFGLREAARTGSWDCLTLLLDLLERIPAGLVPGDIVDHALELARMAALDGMPEAMATYGWILVHSPLIFPDPKEGLFWLKKAWKAGSLEGGVRFADAILKNHRKNQSALEEARHALEECCEQIYPDAIALLGQMDVYDEDDAIHLSALDLMRHAAMLGASQRYVDTLWLTLLHNLEYPGVVADCEKRLKELALERNDQHARYRLAQLDLVLRRKMAPKQRPPIERLEELDAEGFAKASSLLATIFSFGFHGIARNGEKAGRWLAEALHRHEPRAHALVAYGALRDAADRSYDEVAARYAELSALMEWLAYPKEDDLALALVGIHAGLLDDPKADERFKDVPKEEAQGLARDAAHVLADALWNARSSGDLATLLVLCQGFGMARASSHHERVASLVLEDWQMARTKGLPACQCVANLCLSLMVRLGEVEILSASLIDPKARK